MNIENNQKMDRTTREEVILGIIRGAKQQQSPARRRAYISASYYKLFNYPADGTENRDIILQLETCKRIRINLPSNSPDLINVSQVSPSDLALLLHSEIQEMCQTE